MPPLFPSHPRPEAWGRNISTEGFTSTSCSPQRSWGTISCLLSYYWQAQCSCAAEDGTLPVVAQRDSETFTHFTQSHWSLCVHVIPESAVPNIPNSGQHGTKARNILQSTLQLATHPGSLFTTLPLISCTCMSSTWGKFHFLYYIWKTRHKEHK